MKNIVIIWAVVEVVRESVEFLYPLRFCSTLLKPPCSQLEVTEDSAQLLLISICIYSLFPLSLQFTMN